MQIPPAERFTSDPSAAAPGRYWAPVGDNAYDLAVPEGEEWQPDAASIAFARIVLRQLDAVVGEAVAHVARVADLDRLGLTGSRPQVLGVYCDAPRERVEVSLNWEVQRYMLWKVTFAWRADGHRTPVELSVRPW